MINFLKNILYRIKYPTQIKGRQLPNGDVEIENFSGQNVILAEQPTFDMIEDIEEVHQFIPAEPMEKEDWEAHRIAGQTKRWKNFDDSLDILTAKKIPFRILNRDVGHIRVLESINFWPTTGKFYDHVTAEKGRGVFNLIKYIEQQYKK